MSTFNQLENTSELSAKGLQLHIASEYLQVFLTKIPRIG